MAFDYKKEYKEFYLPNRQPVIIDVPPMNYLAVRGHGDPNLEGGEYKESIGLLYAVAFTIKMSKKGDHKIQGYFDYVVPPLEGFWWQGGQTQDAQKQSNQNQTAQSQNTQIQNTQKQSSQTQSIQNQNTQTQSNQNKNAVIDYCDKANFNFISVIRLPDFVTQEDFAWAIAEATRKQETKQGKVQKDHSLFVSKDFSKVEFLQYDEGKCVQCMHVGPYDSEPATIEIMHQYMQSEGYELDIQNPRYHHEIYLSDPRRCQPEKLKTVIRHPIIHKTLNKL